MIAKLIISPTGPVNFYVATHYMKMDNDFWDIHNIFADNWTLFYNHSHIRTGVQAF